MSIIIKATQVTHRDIHECISIHNFHAHRCKKKSMNYILTLHVYKTFLVLEKKIHHNIILIRCLNYPEVTLRENVMSQTF